MDLTLLTLGGPCKITDGANVIYTEGAVTLEPQLNLRDIPSSVMGDEDKVIVDLTWKIAFTPKSVWSSAYRTVLLPSALYNFSTSGAALIGAASRAVTVLGADGEQYAFARAAITKPPELQLGLGASLYGPCEYTAFLNQGSAPTDATAFYTQSTGVTWSQSDFPTAHQESLCTGAWGSVTGWTTVYAEAGFKLSHELKLEPVKQGNITVDMKVIGYRGMLSFKPQGPTSAQLLTALGAQGTSAGIGSRLSTRANSMVVTGSGISVTMAGAAIYKGNFTFDAKLNRHGEWGMITSQNTPATRLTFA